MPSDSVLTPRPPAVEVGVDLPVDEVRASTDMSVPEVRLAPVLMVVWVSSDSLVVVEAWMIGTTPSLPALPDDSASLVDVASTVTDVPALITASEPMVTVLTLLSVLVVTAPLLVGFGPAVSAAATAKRPVPTCSTVTPQMIKQNLKLTVTAAKRSAAAGNTDFLCEYGDKISSLAVVIEYNSASSSASFTTVEDGFNTNNEPTTGAGKTFGSLANEGFWATLGSGQYVEHSVVVRQNKLEVDLASSSSVSNLVALMKKVLVLV